MSPEDMTRWTIRLALGAYAGSLAIRLCAPDRPAGKRALHLARGLWTAGCLLLWLHVACAFHVYHHWSHAEAWEHTRRETAAVAGVNWGGGIYFNYLLMLLWTADLGWWWCSEPTWRTRSAWWGGVLQAYLAFIILNATVVFETGPVRWVALACTLGLSAAWLARLRRR